MPAILNEGGYTRSSFTLEELVDRVQGDLGLRNSNFVTSGDICRWANDAQTQMARDSQAFHVSFTVSVTSGTAEYALPSEPTGRLLTVDAVLHDDIPLRLVGQDVLDDLDVYWRTASPSTPLYYYMRGFSCIGLYPCPDATDEDALVVYATALPPELTEPEDLFYIVHGMEDAVVSYCCMRASLKDAFGEGSKRLEIYRDEWKEARERCCRIADAVATNEVLIMGSDAFGGDRDPYALNLGQVVTPLS